MLELHYKKEDLKKWTNGKKFCFISLDSSKVRNMNRTTIVFIQDKQNNFREIGRSVNNSASFKGHFPVANDVISSIYGYKTDGYMLKRKDILVKEIYLGMY